MRGRVVQGSMENLEDVHHVFDNIPGTFRYWQQRRYEVLAKLKQLGPFQFFFTLSCADKRWAENFVSILNQMGHNVVFEKSGCTDNIEKDEIEAFVDGQPL